MKFLGADDCLSEKSECILSYSALSQTLIQLVDVATAWKNPCFHNYIDLTWPHNRTWNMHRSVVILTCSITDTKVASEIAQFMYKRAYLDCNTEAAYATSAPTLASPLLAAVESWTRASPSVLDVHPARTSGRWWLVETGWCLATERRELNAHCV